MNAVFDKFCLRLNVSDNVYPQKYVNVIYTEFF